MEKDVLEKYKKAQSVWKSTIIYAKTLTKEGARILDIGEAIESKIKSLGGRAAFPVNISINENAAHYTPDVNDTTTLKLDDLVKIDVGVHIDGYIWDGAFSVCIGKKKHKLIDASKKALEAALKLIMPGAKISNISEAVEKTLQAAGCNPVRNLCGHGLERYNQHAWPSIPNGRNNIQDEIQLGSVIAMEVFATNGSGWVKESRPVLIYSYYQDKPVRMPEARKILEMSKTEFNGLPFTKRWLKEVSDSQLKIDMALKQLIEVEAVKEYPILKEETGGLVAQAEKTIIV